jgi:hypothetical protein
MRNIILTIGAAALAVGCTTGTPPYVLLPDDELDRALAQFPDESEMERRAIQRMSDADWDRFHDTVPSLMQFPDESGAIQRGMSEADWNKFHDTAPAD